MSLLHADQYIHYLVRTDGRVLEPPLSFYEMNALIFIIFLLIFIHSAELKMDVLRERECKDSIERQLADERKLRGKLSILFCPARIILLHSKIEMFKNDPSDSWLLLSAYHFAK